MKVKIADLHQDYYARQALNDDRILQLALLLESGVRLSPILITPDYSVIDGRHRIKAHELQELTEIEAKTVQLNKPLEIMARASKENSGGSLPQTNSDIIACFQALLNGGVPRKDIMETFCQIYPSRMVSDLLRRAVDNINKSKIKKALSLVAENPSLSLEEICAHHNIPLTAVQEAISRSKGKRNNGQGAKAFQIEVRSKFSRFNRGLSQTLIKVVKALDEGELDQRAALNIVGEVSTLGTKQTRLYLDWQNRIKARE